ncbi:S1C family serine protease [Rehaibacterium terrae]|jgi:serine protease DegQ|uniref:Serine peptidase DegS n=1 Tax=Rehaibacterium terrae TaxID=1341696 RepID=A0A7W8DDJ5_9GAMM|nr:trypsin-like peptidase domain-containing protein [Rehaibacterium terrae]MBB5015166.1 serine peptidase DegS [Rehaibacterium terrae]
MPIARFLLQAAVAGLALAFLVSQLTPGAAAGLRRWAGLPTPAAVTGPAMPPPGPASYADAVSRAAPAVVNIYADKIVTERSLRLVPDPLMQRYSTLTLGPPRQRLERSLGSGVLVSGDGYVLTNHHVIAGAGDIRIVLQDGRVTQARVVGSDGDTDLAVLKIEGEHLPALPLDTPGPLRVGDVVLAIGNPFGLGQTVTQGIVSALGRNQLHIATYEDFIQTDAAINRGNSGGALVNARGELVGINTAVFTQRVPDANGIGFAIPVSTARMVLDHIVREGGVVRGWLGAEYFDGSGRVAGSAHGVTISAVHPGSPAELAGLRPGDVLTELDGSAIADPLELRRREADLAPGTRVALAGMRAGIPFRAELTLARRPPPAGA